MLNEWTLWKGEDVKGRFVLLVESHLPSRIARTVVTNAFCHDGVWCFQEGLKPGSQFLEFYRIGKNRVRTAFLFDRSRGDRVYYTKQPTLPDGKEFLLAELVSNSYNGVSVVDVEEVK